MRPILAGIGAVAGMLAAVALFIFFLSEWFELWDWLAHKSGSSIVFGLGYFSFIWIPLLGIVFAGAYDAAR